MADKLIDDTGLPFDVSDLLSLTSVCHNPMRNKWTYFAQFRGAVVELSADDFRHALYASRGPFPESGGDVPGLEIWDGCPANLFIPSAVCRKAYQYPRKLRRGTPVQAIWRELEQQ